MTSTGQPVGASLTSVICPRCTSQVRVACGDVTGMTLDEMIDDALAQAERACPAHVEVTVGGMR